jgi:hypothetical protein
MNISSLFNRRVILIPAMAGAILTLGGGAVLAAPGGQAGTTLSAYKTAEGFWEQIWDYDWSVTKQVDPASYEFIAVGEQTTVNYIIDVTKSGPTQLADSFGAEGEVCVTNGGDRATEGLAIADDIMYKIGSGKFKILHTSSVDTSAYPVLGPGETYCYPYKIAFTPVNGAKYKNSVRVTITNHSGRLGTPFGPSPDAGFYLPGEPELIYQDEKASLTDVFGDTSLTSDFIFDFSDMLDWPMEFTASSEVAYPLGITYEGLCEAVFILSNTATLTEADTLTAHESTANLVLQGPACGDGDEDPDPVGCTRTQGYWKTHGPEGCRTGNNSNEWPVNELRLGNNTYYESELCSILNEKVEGNGLVSLAHQLIAAKLNVATGTAPYPTDTIAQADFLIGNLIIPPYGTGRLDPNLTDPVTRLLDMFNNGKADYDSDGDIDGPPHCN